ncbi:MAG: short-chain dehydrogenase [Candidatus Sericytochromatia bacterium]|nr:short-chain dehydrogenase [Candidatus Tanganyikabacteria bacterium]
MNLQGKKILILGGAGMVGMAVARELLKEGPARIIVHSLRAGEAADAVAALAEEQDVLRERASLFAEAPPPVGLAPDHGNLFVRLGLHEREPGTLMGDPLARRMIIGDLIGEFSDADAARFFLYDLIARHAPDLVVDTVNTATGIAYGDLYTVSADAYAAVIQADEALAVGSTGAALAALQGATERLIATQYVPQLVRHVQVLWKAMKDSGAAFYVKVGTSGTGGMGLNIPYTHGEERPSRMLLSKSAVAGAHTLLLFLQARTPDSPITKEIKPAAAIAWKRFGYGEINRRGKPILLEDAAGMGNGRAEAPETLKAVYVDTGENGLFSVDEFVAISTLGQMEFVTPEEIARNVVAEVKGANTGKDVIDALNIACMGPTYRAGFVRNYLLDKLRHLQETLELEEHHTLAMAFEVLGPPRLSKLLYEAYLLKLEYGSVEAASQADPAEMCARLAARIETDAELRKKIVSIGIPILLETAAELRLLRGQDVAIPRRGAIELSDPAVVDTWAEAGWVDLREANMARWVRRMHALLREIELIPAGERGSRYVRDRDFWGGTAGPAPIDPGEVVGWLFNTEDQGERGRD